MLLTRVKKLEMAINHKPYESLSNKKIKVRELPIESINISVANQDTLNMRINIPNTEADIVVDARWLMEACKKIIALEEI